MQRRALARGKLGVVAEPGDGLRLAQQQARRVPAGSQQSCHTLRHRHVVPEQPQIPRTVPEGIADLVERQQPGIGVRRVGEPAEHQWQQRALDGRSPRHTGGQRPDVPQRTGRVGVTQRLEPGLGGLRGEPGHLTGQTRHRVEQRPVEEFLVQPLDLARILTPPGEQFLGRVQPPGGAAWYAPAAVPIRAAPAAVARLGRPGRPGRCVAVLCRLAPAGQPQRAADPAQHLGLLGHGVGPPQVPELEQMLDPAQEPVGGGQLGRVLPADVPARGEHGQGGQGGRLAQRLIDPAVHELEELDGELDIPQPARAELDLPARRRRGQRADHPAPHRLHVGDEVLPLGGLPDQRVHLGGVGGAERGVPRDRPGLQQRLELPGLCPALVVGAVAGQGPHQRAVAPLGPQVGVHGEQRALRGALRTHLDQPGGELGRGAQRRRLSPALAGPGGLRDEDHVHVAGVVQLPGAALAHGDHRQPAGRGPRWQVRPGDRQGRRQRRRRQVGQLGGDLVEGRLPGKVSRRQRQQPPPVRDPQRGHRIGARLAGPRRAASGLGRDRLRVLGAGTDRGQQLGPDLGRFRGGKVVLTCQDPPVLRMPGQVISQRRAGPEHRRQPGTQPGAATQRPDQFLVAGHPRQRGQRQIGIRCGGQRVDQPVARLAGIHGEIPGEQEFRPGRVGETQPGQPCGSGGPARHAHPSTVTVRRAPADAGQQNAGSACPSPGCAGAAPGRWPLLS